MASNEDNTRICLLHSSKKRSNLDPNEVWFCDRVKVTNFSYNWEVDNFNSFNGELISAVFSSEKQPQDIKWQLAITKVCKIIILKLKLVSSNQPELKFKFRGSMQNNNGINCTNIGKDNLYTAVPKDVFIFPRPIEIEDDLRHAAGDDGILSVRCEINVIEDVIDAPPITDLSSKALVEGDMFEDMGKLLCSGKFSDVILMVEQQELKAHKNILSMRSEVFEAMFEHESMMENTSNRVEINDMEYSVVHEMLTFIYTNEAPNIEDMAMELFVAADKYSLKKLKTKCELLLNRQMTCDTALTTLILADRHNSDVLKLRTIHFIKTNLAKIMKTEDWQTMIGRYPQLIEEIERYNGCIGN
ncbi:protein roadkill-like [Musca autumnalis]|uniref:protein roadkill-like n=1 Tax=Musca autumnalis TaxID=221902 RepID=UPI003CEF3638